jgi:hypothetical protein
MEAPSPTARAQSAAAERRHDLPSTTLFVGYVGFPSVRVHGLRALRPGLDESPQVVQVSWIF